MERFAAVGVLDVVSRKCKLEPLHFGPIALCDALWRCGRHREYVCEPSWRWAWERTPLVVSDTMAELITSLDPEMRFIKATADGGQCCLHSTDMLQALLVFPSRLDHTPLKTREESAKLSLSLSCESVRLAGANPVSATLAMLAVRVSRALVDEM
jgi:hypothetical protein